jgi:hypothetical protein
MTFISFFNTKTASTGTAVKEKFYDTDKDWRDIIEIYKNDSDMD